jgi:alpha-galactosidase
VRLWLPVILASALVSNTPVAQSRFDFAFDEEQRRWTLSNGVVEAVFELTPEGYFQFRRFGGADGGNLWAAPDGVPVSPIEIETSEGYYDGRTPFQLAARWSEEIPREGRRETIVLEDAGSARIRVELEMYANQPVLRTSVRFTNRRANAVTVVHADMAPLSFHDQGASYRVFRVNQFADGGVTANFEPLEDQLTRDLPVVVNSGAHRRQCAWLTIRDQNDRGLFAGLEFNGRAVTTVQHAPDQGLVRLSSVIEQLNRPLQPQEEFAVPPMFLGAYRGDWDEAGYRTQRFVEAANAAPPPEGEFPYAAWDSWGYGTEIDEAVLRRNAEIAASLGVELFLIDLGWARQLGDWQADPVKFPSGLKSLSDYVHSLGMKFGLHYALLEAAPDSPVLLQNPDWTSSVDNTYLLLGSSICPAHRPVREWLVEQTLRMIDEYGVDWVLQDGENMVKVCTKSTHTHDPLDSNYANAVDGLDWVVDEVLRQRPSAVWENCEDGGNMMTFAMTRRYVTSIASDNADVMTTRRSMYGATYPFPPRYTDRYMQDEELDTYTTRSYMFGGPWILMNQLPRMSSRDLAFAASEIQLYKTLRGRIRGGKVFHLLGPPRERAIDAIESYDPATDSAVVFVFRAGATESSETVMVRGLSAGRSYRVRFQNSSRALQGTGAELESRGVTVNLPELYSGEIVYVEPVSAAEALARK